MSWSLHPRMVAWADRLALVCALIGLANFHVERARAQDQISDQDRSQPIEIEADLLTLEQANSLAIFEGHVLAVQGELSLKAAQLKVYYVTGGSDDGVDGTTGAAAGGGAGSQQSIRLIEAEGDVVIASPSETASGDFGTYDVVAETMQLSGDVVLTSEGNVLKGDVLDIDLVRNVHRLSSSPENKGGRIKALFVPAKEGAR